MLTYHTHNNSLQTVGNSFVELAEINSTNTYAMEQIQAKVAEHGTVFFAHHQTNGKGTRGKNWHSEKGNNITMSVVLDMQRLVLHKQFLLSATIALSVYDFLNKYVQNDIKIKWPNDIYYKNNKIAGILIENTVKGANLQWAVVGIGININQTNFSNNLANATSLTLINSKNYSTLALAKELCICLEHRFNELWKKKELELMSEYNSHLYKLNEVTKLKKGNILFSCTIKKVTETGYLVIDNGLEQKLAFGEVEWLIG